MKKNKVEEAIEILIEENKRFIKKGEKPLYFKAVFSEEGNLIGVGPLKEEARNES